MEIERNVELYVDIHGHSRMKNIFMYGCTFTDLSTDPKHNAMIKVLPRVVNSKMTSFAYSM